MYIPKVPITTIIANIYSAFIYCSTMCQALYTHLLMPILEQLCGRYYYSHFTDEETEALRVKWLAPKVQS
jgi:hypothetical protein